MPYWYDGYRHFFSPANAARAILTNLHELEKVVHGNWPFTLALLLAIPIIAVPHPSRTWGWVGGSRAWPVWLPPLLGILLYLQVHLEGRYIAAFVTILATLPFLIGSRSPTRMAMAALALLVAGTVINLDRQLKPAIQLAIHRADPESGGQWAIAQYLAQAGLKPGDRVASVTTLNDIRCTWAYAARLHVVADIGNDAFDPGLQQQDFNLFWTDPAIQADVLRLFRQQGAVAVVVPHAATPPLTPVWQSIAGTDAWLLRF